MILYPQEKRSSSIADYLYRIEDNSAKNGNGSPQLVLSGFRSRYAYLLTSIFAT